MYYFLDTQTSYLNFFVPLYNSDSAWEVLSTRGNYEFELECIATSPPPQVKPMFSTNKHNFYSIQRSDLAMTEFLYSNNQEAKYCTTLIWK